MTNKTLVRYGVVATLLSGASLAAAEETSVWQVENYCWSNSADGNTFVCEEGDREWGRATNIPHPPVEEGLTVTQNYTTEDTITQADNDRCFKAADALPKYHNAIIEAWVNCSVTVDWYAYPVAKGDISAAFGDPLEQGILNDSLREGGDPKMSWKNIVADVKAVGCNCFVRVPAGPK